MITDGERELAVARRLKAERLYAKFCKDQGIDAANLEVVSQAISWHRLRNVQGATVAALARSEASLSEEVEKVERIMHAAGVAAAEWARTNEEPA